MNTADLARFEALVSPEPMSGCWLWLGGGDYSSFWADGHLTHVGHRVSYEHFVGLIPPGLTLDHKCRVHCCVNPAHLEPVTNHVNILRGIAPAALNARKTACPNGHPYEVNSRGWRICRQCHGIRTRANWKRAKAAGWRRTPAILTPEQHRKRIEQQRRRRAERGASHDR